MRTIEGRYVIKSTWIYVFCEGTVYTIDCDTGIWGSISVGDYGYWGRLSQEAYDEMESECGDEVRQFRLSE